MCSQCTQLPELYDNIWGCEDCYGNLILTDDGYGDYTCGCEEGDVAIMFDGLDPSSYACAPCEDLIPNCLTCSNNIVSDAQV